MRCHYCEKNNHNTADCRAISKFKQKKKAYFEAKSEPRKNCLAFLFEEINALKSQLKPENTASNKKREAEPHLSTEINESTYPLVVMKIHVRSTFLLLLSPLVL
jgi:hypothetical protein